MDSARSPPLLLPDRVYPRDAEDINRDGKHVCTHFVSANFDLAVCCATLSSFVRNSKGEGFRFVRKLKGEGGKVILLDQTGFKWRKNGGRGNLAVNAARDRAHDHPLRNGITAISPWPNLFFPTLFDIISRGNKSDYLPPHKRHKEVR